MNNVKTANRLELQELIDQFENPAPTFRPQPFWFLNHRLEKPELERQIQSMGEAGVGGVVLHARHGMQAPYLSADFMEALAFCTKECARRDMVVWLYDEDNWPSGTVGGKLTRQHPEYRMRYLRMEEKRFAWAEAQEALPLDFVQHDHNELIAILAYRATEREGQWLLYDDPVDITHLWGHDWKPDTEDCYIVLACWSCEIAEGMTFAQGYYLDTLNPAAVQAFIHMAYEPFHALRSYFGSTIQGVFTDEPGLMIHDGFFGVEAIRTAVDDVGATLPGMVFAWTEGMAQRYQQENGYDLIPRLGALLYNMADGSRSTKQQYYDTITRWYVEGYHAAIRSWCERQGLLYIGHTLEEPVWGQARSQGNQTRVLQQFHYAGVDYLTPGIGTKENPHRIVSVKTAASVAQLDSKERVICESFGASGHGYSMRQRRLDANFMAFLGVNLFIPHAFYYSFAGIRKTDFPPTEFLHAPHWPHYRAFADYLGRLSLLGASSTRTPKVLLMSPIHTVYENMFVSGGSNKQPSSDVLFSRLSDRMLRESIDYDYVDECQLRESTLVKGEGLRFTVNENIYSVIVLPEIEVMTKDVAQFLLSFVKQGGTLITIGTIPQHSESLHQDPALAAIMQELFPLQPLHAELHKVDKGYSLFYSLKEQKDAAPAESAVEEQTVEQHVSLERFCVRLREMLSRSPAIRWRLIEGQSGDLITVERVFGNRVFAWLMNWSEQSISLQLESGAVPSMIEEWDLESGKISPFNQDAVLSFAPGELRVVSVQTPLQTSTEMLQEAKSGAVRISEDIVLLPEKWQFQAVDGNVFLLDQWQVTLNDRQSRMNATMPGQVNTYRTVFNVSSALMERLQSKRGISYPEGSLKDRFAKVELILDDVQQRIPSHIGFLQRRRNLEIFVNGVRQNSLQPSSWQDSYYDSLDITSQIKAGENELEILTVSLLEPMPAISFPAYLVGSFIIEDQMTLNVESEHICGTWDTAGYPYYSGAGVYTQHVDLSPSDLDASDEIWLEAEDIRETACLYVNDKEAGVRLWPPYHWNITDFVEQGSNRVTLQVANTLDNLYGKALLCSGVNGRVKLVRRSWR